MENTQPLVLFTKNLNLNTVNETDLNGFRIAIFHRAGDPVTANRITISSGKTKIELLPSKGLSLSQAWMANRQLFWDAPIGLPDTEDLDLWSDEVLINGSPAHGFTFLKTMVAGVELYGLKNWGMPKEKEGNLELLHGETSNIPVEKVLIYCENDKCTIEGSFIYRGFREEGHKPWYERGEALFEITKKITVFKNVSKISLNDTFRNLTNQPQTPDWGYHITFKPEDGATLAIPSTTKEMRGGGSIPSNFNTWKNSDDKCVRDETGIIYKQLKDDGPSGNTTSVLSYPDGAQIKVTLPQVPYFQTWFCRGGRGTKEFTFKNGQSLLERNWDGMGIEIGSSALDHDGNTDPSVIRFTSPLLPGESVAIPIDIQLC